MFTTLPAPKLINYRAHNSNLTVKKVDDIYGQPCDPCCDITVAGKPGMTVSL